MQKSKSKTPTAPTPLETALQKQFRPDAGRLDMLIREAYERTAKIQAANIAAMVGFGLLALSIKPIIGHGKFGNWLKETLGGQMGKSTAYSWIEAAKYLIAKVSTAKKQSDIVSERICEFTESANIKDYVEEVFSDAKLTANFVAYVSRDLPFKTFLNILKTANANAIEAEEAEAKAPTAAAKGELKSLKGGIDRRGQMDFYGTLFEETRATIETSRSDARFVEMTSEQLIDYGNYLIAQGRDIVEIGKNKKD